MYTVPDIAMYVHVDIQAVEQLHERLQTIGIITNNVILTFV